MVEFVKDYIEQKKRDLDTIDPQEVVTVVDLLFDAWKQGNQVFIFGNGGSAATASHFACDIAKNTVQRTHDHSERRFRVNCLNDNTALMTALANDVSYDHIFAQQLQNHVSRDDLAIAITGSGNSQNIIEGLNLAKKFGAKTIALLGFDGGKVKGIVDHSVHVRSDHYGRIEDCHLTIHHLVTDYLKKKIKDYYG